MSEHRYVPGKVDYRNKGRRNCEAEITWTLEDGRFSMQAAIWNERHTDIYVGGQAVEEVAKFFPNDAKVQRMRDISRRWHLNHMQPGTPAQMEIVRKLGPLASYDFACEMLDKAGLLVDHGYRYGTAWLTEELPAEVVREIELWGGH